MTDLDRILESLDVQPDALHATKEERAERYARLVRDCEARRARAAFFVVE